MKVRDAGAAFPRPRRERREVVRRPAPQKVRTGVLALSEGCGVSGSGAREKPRERIVFTRRVGGTRIRSPNPTGKCL